MAYWLLQNDQATYAIDWDVVHRLVLSYHRAVARDVYSKVTSTSNSDWYNPFSWSMPDIRSLDVDWAKVRSESIKSSDDDFARLAERATRDVRDLHRELSWMVADTARRTNNFTDQLGAIQSDNMSRINSAVDSYGTQIEVAKFVRDTSADGLMVGASILSGGAGLAVLGGGSTLKGWAKYQDTDNAGAAVLTGVGAFTFGAFKLGGTKLTRGEEAVVVLLQAQWETAVALTEGKSIGESLATGSLKLTGPFIDRFFKADGVKKILDRACLPISITVSTAAGVENVAPTVVGKWLGKVAQKQGVEKPGKAAIKSIAGHTSGITATTTSRPHRSTAIGSATLANDALLTLAIVNMDKGIGRGL